MDMPTRVNNEFEIEDIVYLRTDVDQLPRIIVSFEVFKNGEILYKLNQRTISSYHYGFELSRTKDVLLTTTN